LKLLGIAGASGSGKTVFLVQLIGILRARGLRVSTIKHAHHAVELDQPGKDSHRHSQAGAQETILATSTGFALFAKSPAAPTLPELLARLAPVDLVLLEGFRGEKIPKLEIHRPALGKPPLWPQMPVLAVASDAKLPDCPYPVLDLNAPEAAVDFLLLRLGLNRSAVKTVSE
jgi:molybdopterin-guanine dinucleotide biosynthesis protein B